MPRSRAGSRQRRPNNAGRHSRKISSRNNDTRAGKRPARVTRARLRSGAACRIRSITHIIAIDKRSQMDQ
jgi:hypothetical protein